ncbi:MAG: CD225/dispanin family protein [Thermoguttaceae bacterium]
MKPSVSSWRLYFALSLLALILCSPLGAPGLFFAARARRAEKKGNAQDATRYLRSARAFSLFALGLQLPLVGFYFLLAYIYRPV